MLKTIKVIAIMIMIAVASVAIVVFGTFIGAILLFLGAIFVTGATLWFFWMIYQEQRDS